MSGTIFTIIGFLIGIMILIAGLYYFFKSKEDAESRKIYGITGLIGIGIIIGILVKIVIFGF